MNILWEKALDFLVSTIGPSAVDYWRKNSDVDSDLLNLRAALSKAHLLIERSECWRLPKYDPIDKLLYQLKDSVYEAESIVDELEYERLKNKVEKSFPGIDFLRNWMRDFSTTVKRVLYKLNNVYNELQEICDRHGIPQNPNKFSENARPFTSPFLDTSNEYYGRDKEFNELIRRMGVPSSGSPERKKAKTVSVSNFDFGESSSSIHNKQNVSVLSIVGMGGVGKTTLAQMACNHKSVNSHFDLIMWACVSDNFDSERLTKEILESATKIECNLTTLHALQKTLKDKLNSKRFLLVLDDVWSTDWQRVLAPMEGASEGSVVLVTTRSLKWVKLRGKSIGSRGVINLEGLEEHIYWDFFKSCAFDSVAESYNINQKVLEDIGKEICVKLKGSPLAAKTIGGVLSTDLDVGHWTHIKDSKMWEFQTEEHDILPVLQLSYQYLPSHLKKCFSFCSLYPKDFKFTQSELTEFWIMQGLIKPLDNFQQLRTLAKGYFLELERRSFFQDAHTGNYEYVIHDLMHDVCQSITKDECICLEDGQSEQEVSPDIRHVSEFGRKLTEEERNKLGKNKKLLFLKVAYTQSYSSPAMRNWCKELTNIRSLSLARCRIKKLPENIGNLRHLQFLDISDTYVKTLPESFCSLYILQYLNMKNCNDIESFPEGLNNLINLLLFILPWGKAPLVGHMENTCKAIQLYDPIVITEYVKIENLKNICKLSGSVIINGLDNVPDKEAAEKAQLDKKPLINSLELGWYDPSVSNEHHYEKVLNGLCPHPNLNGLKITNYGGTNLSPSWLKKDILPNLTEVIVNRCKASTISHLPHFITKLDIYFCEELESLPVGSFDGFESLEWLRIYYCPKLRSPNALVIPPSVKVLKLEKCGELEKSISSCLQNLTSLETLIIGDCQSLVSIPAEVASNFKSLSKLTVTDCSKLWSLGGRQFLESLEEVTIWDCPKLVETGGQNVLGKMPSELVTYTYLSPQVRKRTRNSSK